MFLSPSASLTSLSLAGSQFLPTSVPTNPYLAEPPRVPGTFILAHPRTIVAACLPLQSSFGGPSKGSPSSRRALLLSHIYPLQEEVGARKSELWTPRPRVCRARPMLLLRTPHLLPTGPRAAPPLGSAPLRAAATLAAAGSRFWEAIRAARGGKQELRERRCNCRAGGLPARV